MRGVTHAGWFQSPDEDSFAPKVAIRVASLRADLVSVP